MCLFYVFYYACVVIFLNNIYYEYSEFRHMHIDSRNDNLRFNDKTGVIERMVAAFLQ